jgi:hypothetical protein
MADCSLGACLATLEIGEVIDGIAPLPATIRGEDAGWQVRAAQTFAKNAYSQATALPQRARLPNPNRASRCINLSLTLPKRTARIRSSAPSAIVDIRTKLEQTTNILKTGESYV